MESALSKFDIEVLRTLAIVRGLRPETALKYPALAEPKTVEAMRKRLERLALDGFLAKSSLPAGPQIFRLSRKGVKHTGAPAAFADSPSEGIACEMISVSNCASLKDFTFLTNEECDALFTELFPNWKPMKFPVRFVLRELNIPGDAKGEFKSETHLHFWISELKSPDQLARRVDVVSKRLTESHPLFAELIATHLLGATIAVVSKGVKQTLETKTFPVETTVIVVEQLNSVISTKTKS